MGQASLFEASGGPIEAGLDWLTGTLLASIAVGVCVLAVAAIGLMMLGGRLPLRRGARVVLGCFVLLGAPVIAAGLMAQWSASVASSGSQDIVLPEPSDRPDLPPSEYDPYAGASLRRD